MFNWSSKKKTPDYSECCEECRRYVLEDGRKYVIQVYTKKHSILPLPGGEAITYGGYTSINMYCSLCKPEHDVYDVYADKKYRRVFIFGYPLQEDNISTLVEITQNDNVNV